MLTEKYQELLKYGESLGMKDVSLREEEGKLYIKGVVPYRMEKHLFWDKIKTHDNWKEELSANIKLENEDIFGIYMVQPGDTLSKIAKKYLGNAMKYMDIFNLNTDILSDPNRINVGQKLKIPTKES